MNFALQRFRDPDIEPVSLADAIQQVREFSDLSTAAQDQLTALIVSAREWAEEETGRALIDQSWRLTIGESTWPLVSTVILPPIIGYRGNWLPCDDGSIYLRRSPVLQVTKFASVASDGTETDVDASSYALRDAGAKRPRIVPLSSVWTTGSYIIEYRAGYADRLGSPTQTASVVPQRFKQAILLHVQAHYDQDDRLMDKQLEAAKNLLRGLNADLPIA